MKKSLPGFPPAPEQHGSKPHYHSLLLVTSVSRISALSRKDTIVAELEGVPVSLTRFHKVGSICNNPSHPNHPQPTQFSSLHPDIRLLRKSSQAGKGKSVTTAAVLVLLFCMERDDLGSPASLFVIASCMAAQN
ncbi:unnamed protein product [Caretta caretta]